MKLNFCKGGNRAINTSHGLVNVVDGVCDVSNEVAEFLVKNFPAEFVKAAVAAVNDQITDAVTQAPKAPVAAVSKKK